MTHFYSLESLKKYVPYVLVAVILGVAYLYASLSKDTQYIGKNRTVVTNHWTGEVKRCVVAPDQKLACRPADSIEVPWYMAIVQHTFESFN